METSTDKVFASIAEKRRFEAQVANKHRERTLANLNAKIETNAVHSEHCVNPDHGLRNMGKVVADQTGEVVPHGWLCLPCAKHDLDRTNPKPQKDV